MKSGKIIPVILILAVIVCACANEPPSNSVKIGKEADGTKISFDLSGLLIINLKSNPTTGYSWSAAEIDTSILKLIDKTYIPDQPQLTGSGGNVIFKYAARRAGSVKLKLVYARPWENNTPPADSLRVLIEIRK